MTKLTISAAVAVTGVLICAAVVVVQSDAPTQAPVVPGEPLTRLRLAKRPITPPTARPRRETEGEIRTAVVESKEPEKKTALEALIEEYNEAVEELQAEIDDYRASIPTYGEFIEKLTDFLVPLVIEGERARLYVHERVQAEIKKDENFKLDYDGKLADKLIHEILSSTYREVAVEIEGLIRSGEIELGGQEATLFHAAMARIKEFARPNGWDQAYPYEPGTLENEEFIRNLSLAALQYSGAFMNPMFKLPRDLERKRKAVDALYEELVSQASGTEEPLPPKYEDPAVSLLKRVSKTGCAWSKPDPGSSRARRCRNSAQSLSAGTRG